MLYEELSTYTFCKQKTSTTSDKGEKKDFDNNKKGFSSVNKERPLKQQAAAKTMTGAKRTRKGRAVDGGAQNFAVTPMSQFHSSPGKQL